MVLTPNGDEIEVVFKILESSELIISNHLDGRINEDYPQELQPRDRTKLKSKLQVSNIAKSLRPEELSGSILSSNGSPIIGEDNVVESGNGRVMGICTAYSSGTADVYKDYLEQNAILFNTKPAFVSAMNHPILVRLRITNVDRVKFTVDSNSSKISRKSRLALHHASKQSQKGNLSGVPINELVRQHSPLIETPNDYMFEYVSTGRQLELIGRMVSKCSSPGEIADVIAYYSGTLKIKAPVEGAMVGREIKELIGSSPDDEKALRQYRINVKGILGKSYSEFLDRTRYSYNEIIQGINQVVGLSDSTLSSEVAVKQILLDGQAFYLPKLLNEFDNSSDQTSRRKLAAKICHVLDKLLTKRNGRISLTHTVKMALTDITNGRLNGSESIASLYKAKLVSLEQSKLSDNESKQRYESYVEQGKKHLV